MPKTVSIDLRSWPVRTVLDRLVADKTTKQNIIFATDSYADRGEGFSAADQIMPELLLTRNIIQPRVLKAAADQSSRTKKRAEVFTPKNVVIMMTDMLEKENPGCFDDPTKTFADLYMKSGLFITEIVKRLYNSEAMKQAIPDDKERITHIMQKQVYGMAPTEIIYKIATNYILGFDESLKLETHNFVCADAAEAAKNGTLAELVDQCFGNIVVKD